MTQRRHLARDLAQIAIFAGLIAALGVVPGFQPGWMPAPITLQTLGVMLAGAILGGRKGLLSVVLFSVLTAAGLPLLSGGRGGLTWFTTAPSAGYPYGWMLGALVIGYLTKKILPAYPIWKAVLITVLGGMVLVYAIGVLGSAVNTGTSYWVNLVKALAYVPGDALKVAVTVAVAQQVHRAYPGLMGRTAGGSPIAARKPGAVQADQHA